MKPYITSNAILAYKDALLQLDSSIMCEFYENDLIFIVAIDDDKYDQFEKEINYISFEIHLQFDLEKRIVCMPKDFVSNWDTPIILINSEPNLEKEITHVDNKFILEHGIVFDRFDSQINLDEDTNHASTEIYSLFNKELIDIRGSIYNIQDRNEYEISSQGGKNGCAA